jgi:hypothetical protein
MLNDDVLWLNSWCSRESNPYVTNVIAETGTYAIALIRCDKT